MVKYSRYSRRKSGGKLLTALVLVILLALAAWQTAVQELDSPDNSSLDSQVTKPLSTPALPITGQSAVVKKVVDGDTIVLADDTRIRLIGVDTPETVHPNSPVECFGPEASNHTKQLLPEGTAILVVLDVGATDRYGRTLAYIYRESDKLFINLDLISQGFAVPLAIKPNVAFEQTFRDAANAAEAANIGLWAACPR